MGNSKRILFVITQADWGGAQTFIFNAAREAMRRGFEVLLTYGGEGLLEEKCRDAGVPTRKLIKMKREISVLHDIGAISELVKLMHEWKPDTVFLNSSKAGVVGAIAGRLARVPKIVYRIGGWSFTDPVSPLQKKFRLWMEKLTAPLKDVIVVNTPGGVDLATQHHIHPRQHVALVPNGIDLQKFDASLKSHDDARSQLTDAPATVPVIFTVANFYPAKGLKFFVDALAIVAATRHDIRAVIIGDGEGRAALEAQRATRGLNDILALPGQRADASSLMRGADLFVLPSVKEGFPWALLESMAAGTPAVATDVGGVRWMVDETVRVVPPGDAEALAHAMIEALNDPEGSRIKGAAARRIVEARFTERDVWDKLFAEI
jgi:glycosyltransferase involved in cell wall biosynthesis